jgi:amidophosphoribosyltransferase
MPNRREFVAHNLTEDEVCEVLGADGLLYQSLEDLISSGKELNPDIVEFEASCFTCKYITGDIDEDYLSELERSGRGKKRTKSGTRQPEGTAITA